MAAFDGNVDFGKLKAGQSVGLVGDIEPAADTVRSIAEDHVGAYRAMPCPSTRA